MPHWVKTYVKTKWKDHIMNTRHAKSCWARSFEIVNYPLLVWGAENKKFAPPMFVHNNHQLNRLGVMDPLGL